MCDNSKIETIDYKGYKIEVHYDQYPSNPRTVFDPMGRMLCFSNEHIIGDKNDRGDEPWFDNVDELTEYLAEKEAIALPLRFVDGYGEYGLEAITGFDDLHSDQWDDDLIGYIFVTKETIEYEYGKFTLENSQKAKKYMLGELKEYNAYLNGEVFGKIVTGPNGEEVDSCWGFYGDESREYMIEEAKMTIDNELKYNAEQTALHKLMMTVCR